MSEEVEQLKRRVYELETEVSRMRVELVKANILDEPEYEDDDEYFDEDDLREQEEEELAELAATCKCGAWQFSKDGKVHHVADCCCGAE